MVRWFRVAVLVLIGLVYLAYMEAAHSKTKPYVPPVDVYIEIFKCGELAYLILVEPNQQMEWATPDPTLNGVVRASLIGNSVYYKLVDKKNCQ